MSPATNSSRWCPTPEQLMILEEIYRNGLKTPNAAQIQQITSHLSLYGKIEGKNVFYWFQNHKARDRQKLRRKLYKQLQQQQHQQLVFHYQYHPLEQQLTKQHRFNDHHFHCLQPQYSSLGLHRQQQQLLPSGYFHEREGEEASMTKLMNYGWKAETPERMELEKCAMRTYGHDRMTTMTENEGPHTTCRSGPLKTLELFPITATYVKEDGGSAKDVSRSSSSN